jgi:hypothetical protein
MRRINKDDARPSDEEMAHQHPVIGGIRGGPSECTLSYGCEQGFHYLAADSATYYDFVKSTYRTPYKSRLSLPKFCAQLDCSQKG